MRTPAHAASVTILRTLCLRTAILLCLLAPLAAAHHDTYLTACLAGVSEEGRYYNPVIVARWDETAHAFVGFFEIAAMDALGWETARYDVVIEVFDLVGSDAARGVSVRSPDGAEPEVSFLGTFARDASHAMALEGTIVGHGKIALAGTLSLS